jgi:hypothetical protein
MPTPVTWPSARQFVGLAKETVQGTAVAPTDTLIVTKFDPEDKITYLDDTGMRGSMVETYGEAAGVIHSEIDLAGAVFPDTLPWLLSNIFGDTVAAGTATTPTGTLSAGSSIGAVTVSSSVSIPNGTLIQIDVGSLAEIVITSGAPTGAGPFTIPVPALTKAHLSGVAITAITAPISYASSVLNSGQAQPGSLTFTDWQGPTATVFARAWPGCCLSELNLTWNNESNLFEWTAKAIGYPSAPASAQPTSAPGTLSPQASWRAKLGLAGPASGGTLVPYCTDGEINIKRAATPLFTGGGVQAPYIIQRGKVDMTAKGNFVVPDESILNYYLNNTQPQFQLALTTGTGLTTAGVTADMAKTAFTASKIDRGKEAVMYAAEMRGIANTTNAGASGGFSPGKITVQNAVSTQPY